VNPDRARAALNDLLESEHVTLPTRRVLESRLHSKVERSFFDETAFARLQAVAVRLVPHDPAQFSLALEVDQRLAQGGSDGWRYDDAPPDARAYLDLLAALPQGWLELDGATQDEHLHLVQRDHPRAFEDLLAELAGVYYSHPLAQLELGSLSFADAPGWTQLGLEALDEREREAREALGLA
jgi:gluconate 2-dehydrogenase gamma chain